MICGARCVYNEAPDPHIVPGYSMISLVFSNDEIDSIEMYEISYDKNNMEWMRDPNNPTSPFTISKSVSMALEGRETESTSYIPKLHVGNIEDVISWGWNSTRLVDELEKIDYEVIDDLRPEDEGHAAHWARIRFNHPDTWRTFYKSPGEIAGYWSYLPLFSENLKMLKSGDILEMQISEDLVPAMEMSGHFKIFFTLLTLRENFRGTSSVHSFYYLFLKVAEELAKQGIYFEEIVANAYSPAWIAVCKSFGMNYVRDSPSKGKIFQYHFILYQSQAS
ncbi:MAG: hypothetical protein QXU18_07095 [Thermoplasmatales archaeon]